MKQNLRRLSLLAILPLFTLTLAIGEIGIVDAYKQSGQLEETPETFFIKDKLTIAVDDNVYGGEVFGDFILQVDTHDVKIFTSIDDSTFDGQNLEVWVFDFGEKQWLKVGDFDGVKGHHRLAVESWVYEIIVISEKGDDDTPKLIVGGASLDKSEEYRSCKCF